jgi:hypothetical protein
MEILDSGHERRRQRGDDQLPGRDIDPASDDSEDLPEYLDTRPEGTRPEPRPTPARRVRLAAALATAAVLGGVLTGTVVDRRADERANTAQAELAAAAVRLSTVGFPGDGSFDDDAPPAGPPAGRALLDYRVVVLNSGGSDSELVEVVVPPQDGIAANRPVRLPERLIPAQGQADVNLRLTFDCASRPTDGPVVRIVARPPGGRDVTIEQRVAELHSSISDSLVYRCGDPSVQSSDVTFVSARPQGKGKLVLSFHAKGAVGTRLSTVAVKYPGLVTKPDTAMPVRLRGEAPMRVLVTARVSDCRAALAAADPPELHASYRSDDDGDHEGNIDGDHDHHDLDLGTLAGSDPAFVTAIVRFLYATCR